jgi:hypothetical protein
MAITATRDKQSSKERKRNKNPGQKGGRLGGVVQN